MNKDIEDRLNSIKESLSSDKKSILKKARNYIRPKTMLKKDAGLVNTHNYMDRIFADYPEYGKTILDTLKITLQSDQINHHAICLAYETINKISQHNPEYGKDILDLMKIWPQLDQPWFDRVTAYQTMNNIFKPEYGKDILDLMKTGLQSIDNKELTLTTAYNTMNNILKSAPEYGKDILDLIKIRLQAKNYFDRNTKNSIYETMGNIFQSATECRKDVFDIMKIELLSNDNNYKALNAAYKTLGDIVSYSPEYRNDCLDLIKIKLQSIDNESYAPAEAYETMSNIFQSAPKYGKDILDLIKIRLQSNSNNHDAATAYRTMGNIFQPEYGKDILDLIKIGLQSTDNDSNALAAIYDALYNISQSAPEYGKDIFDLIKIRLQSDKNGIDCSEQACKVIKQIAENNTELHGEILHTILPSQFTPEHKINIAATCLQNKNFDELKAKYPEQTLLLDAAYNIRFCDEAEKTCLINNYSVYQLKELDIGTYKKAKNAILHFEYLSQKSTENNNGEPLSKEQLLQQNQDWLIPNAAALSLVYGKDFPNYLQKIAIYNNYLQTRKAEIGTEKDAKRQTLRETKAAELAKQLQSYALKIKISSQHVEELNQNLEQIKTEGNKAKIDEAQKAYDEARTVLAANQRTQGSLVGTLKSVVGYVDYTNMQPVSAEKATAWMLQVSKMKDAPEVRKCADKYMLGETPEHDKFIRFDMPNVKTEYNEETCQCIRTGQENTDVLSMVLQRYDMLKEHIGNKKFVEIAAMAKALKWAGRDQEFCLSNAEFLSSQQKYNEAESIYLQGKITPSAFADKETVYSTDGTWRCFVASKDDPRIICAGGNFGSKRASCCQSYGNVGSNCAVDSVINPDSGCLVFEKQDKSGNWKMLGCSWFYRTQNQDMKNLTFDNVEINNSVCRQDAKQTQEVFFKMIEQFTNDNYRQITIGSSPDLMLDRSKYNFANNKAPLPDGYSGYSDAHTQWLLYDNPQATPEKLPEILIRGYSDEYKAGMSQVAQKCFPDGDKELSIPDNPQGMVLTDRQGKVCGYCLWDETEKHIYDMAVLPEYRKDKNASSAKLLAEVIKYIKRDGGEWSADLRDKTTLRYMETMQQRGLVDMEKKGIDHTMSDGSKVVTVSFKPITPKQDKTNTAQQTISTNKGGRI